MKPPYGTINVPFGGFPAAPPAAGDTPDQPAEAPRSASIGKERIMKDSHGYGAHAPKPLRGFPEGRARIRIRQGSFPVVHIRPPGGGILAFTIIEQEDGCWHPWHRVGSNTPAANESRPAHLDWLWRVANAVDAAGLAGTPISMDRLACILDTGKPGDASWEAARNSSETQLRRYFQTADSCTIGEWTVTRQPTMDAYGNYRPMYLFERRGDA